MHACTNIQKFTHAVESAVQLNSYMQKRTTHAAMHTGSANFAE